MEILDPRQTYYVSITGLRVKSTLFYPMFWWLATTSMSQALRAPGLIRAEARTIRGVHHTLSIWQSEAAMRSFLTSGAHLHAMRAFDGIATGSTVGYETTSPPSWHDVHDIWKREGRLVPTLGGSN